MPDKALKLTVQSVAVPAFAWRASARPESYA